MALLAAAKLAGPDYFVLVGYFVLTLGIGAYFHRFQKSMKDYFSGGNQVPWWLSGISFYMVSFSAAAFVFYSALAFKYGFVAVTLYWVTVPATLISVIFFSARWRRARITSPVEYLETRYSSSVRQLFAWQGLPVRVIDDALKIVATSTFLSVFLGLDMSKTVFWSSVIMLAYTFMGGLWAVAVTDFVQFVILGLGVLVLLPLSLSRAGGLGHMLANRPEGFFNLTVPEYNWVYLIAMILLFGISFSSINWSLIQRYYCVPTEKDARKVGWLVVALNIVSPPLMFLPAMAGRYFLEGVTDEKQVYPMLCATLLPVGMMGLVIAAMFSATMSMLSSDYNVCANVLTNDVYRRLIRPEASQRELVAVGRISTLLVGVVSIVLAFAMIGLGGEDMFRTMITLFSIATAPVGIPMLAGLLWHRVTNFAAQGGFLYGVLTGLSLYAVLPGTMVIAGTAVKQESIILFATAGMTALMMVVFSKLAPPEAGEMVRIKRFHAKLETRIGGLPEDIQPPRQGRAVSPFRVVGVCLVLIGLMMLAVQPWMVGAAFWTNLVLSVLLVVLGAGMFIKAPPVAKGAEG